MYVVPTLLLLDFLFSVPGDSSYILAPLRLQFNWFTLYKHLFLFSGFTGLNQFTVGSNFLLNIWFNWAEFTPESFAPGSGPAYRGLNKFELTVGSTTLVLTKVVSDMGLDKHGLDILDDDEQMPGYKENSPSKQADQVEISAEKKIQEGYTCIKNGT
ncbi:hypothetical protein BT96DRAFT_950076 [Gymnopus androsaceus JB14]|uniref:Uncharacterized protein n=1 Tax=Gymnopus androsaceus JB14 TaxID=1447944 RepID=A0A6A4GHU8_9AGAR|nr:hypothetical protein BT96DRAFT_950076 [Gymnopus androsaceus JB14]